MCIAVPEMSAAQVLSAFHRDAPYLFLGAAFVAVGIVSAMFSALRPKHDPLLLYFAVFAVLYGLRLWIQAELLQISIRGSWFYPRLRIGINYIVPIPAILFFDSAGFLRGASKIAGHILLVASSVLAAATFLAGPTALYDRLNSVMVIGAMLALGTQSTRKQATDADFAIIRRGLLTFAAFVVWDNLRGVFQFHLPSLEPFGFTLFLASLGYVAARRTLQRDQQLSQIQKELDVARSIQLSILPAEFPPTHHFRVSARYVPMTSVAGDFYDYVIASPQQVGLLIADVSGHGVPAALIASMVKLAAASQRAHAADPSAFLFHMNATLCGNTQEQFVTAAYVHLDSATHEMRYSAAAHPPMLLLRQGHISKIEENGLMLAVFDFATYSSTIQPLENGDRLLLYTDGILEAANAAGEFFGLNTLCEVFRTTAGASPSQAADVILSSVQKWANAQEDDLTVVVCDYIG